MDIITQTDPGSEQDYCDHQKMNAAIHELLAQTPTKE